MTSLNLPSDVRDSITRLAESSDRAAPTVFAGRTDEIDLLDAAVRGTQRNEVGHTVVIHGVPGAGKTALLNEYVARLLAAGDKMKRSIIPVPLHSGNLNAPPATILQAIDRKFREFDASNEWAKRVNRVVDGASLSTPTSLSAALDDYVALRFDRRESTIVLLVDEAQNLSDTVQVREYLESLHGGIMGRTQVVLACFGLANTTNRLRELGLSRLATGHVRSIGALSSTDAERTVTGTLNIVLKDFTFEDGQRERWIGAVAATILSESADFPHHLANGCRALAEIVLDEGIGDEPPVERLRDRCRDHRRAYYDARLHPWAKHTMALAQAFMYGKDEWKPVADLNRALMASDNFGNPVDRRTAATILEELCANGYIEERLGACRPVLHSLTSHFRDMQRDLMSRNEVAQTS